MLGPVVEPMPGAVIVRSDVERKALFGLSETEKLPSFAYTDEVNARVYATLGDKARRIVAAGHSVIVDAVFAKPEERAAFAEAAKSAHFRLRGLFLTADMATRLSRIGGRVRDDSDADTAVAQAQERYKIGHPRGHRKPSWPAPRQPCTVLDDMVRRKYERGGSVSVKEVTARTV